MKSASAGLIAFLNSGQQFCVADLYEITPVGGTTQYFNNSDIDLIWNGHTYTSKQALIKHSKISNKIGLEVDETDIEITPQATDLFAGVTWKTAARRGMLDSAYIVIRTAIMPTWGDTSLGPVHRFEGKFGPLDFDDLSIFATARSIAEALNISLPRNVYQPSCVHTLFDSGCGLNSLAFLTAYTVDTSAGTPTKTLIPISSSLIPAPYWELGAMQFTSGINNGVRRAIKLNRTLQQIVVTPPLPNVPTNGDSLVLVPGCDRLQSTCDSKFSNKDRFRGYPYIPVAETAQ